MYTPGVVPTNPADIPNFLRSELANLANNLNLAKASLQLTPQSVAPSKVMNGLVVLADGTHWNPGSGAGYYGYNAGAWHFLG